MNVDSFDPQISEQNPKPAPGDPHGIPGAGILGMRLLIASLSMLFLSSLMGYFVIRSRSAAWPPAGMPPMPKGLWISTIVILISSGTVQWGLRSARLNRQSALRQAMTATTGLGVLFLIVQGVNWYALLSAGITAAVNLYAFLFYLLTALHAAHVVGGLVLLFTVTARAYRGVYSADFHPGVIYSAMYWHFLDAVWVIVFVVLVWI